MVIIFSHTGHQANCWTRREFLSNNVCTHFSWVNWYAAVLIPFRVSHSSKRILHQIRTFQMGNNKINYSRWSFNFTLSVLCDSLFTWLSERGKEREHGPIAFGHLLLCEFGWTDSGYIKRMKLAINISNSFCVYISMERIEMFIYTFGRSLLTIRWYTLWLAAVRIENITFEPINVCVCMQCE